MKELRTEIVIRASGEKVWRILTDFDRYPDWNPFIRFILGKVAVGEIVKVRLEAPGMKGMLMKPRITKFNESEGFSWLGSLGIPGLFDGEHSFELTDNHDGTTTFVQREEFKGILVPLLKKMLDVNTKEGFEMMNRKLKEECENG